MEDDNILLLFSQRREQALTETQAKYGRLCSRVAEGILADVRDAEECVNDTWMHAWNAIPPERPVRLSAWLAKVTRNLALSRLRSRNALKRGGGEIPVLLEELAECIPGAEDPRKRLKAGNCPARSTGSWKRSGRKSGTCSRHGTSSPHRSKSSPRGPARRKRRSAAGSRVSAAN